VTPFRRAVLGIQKEYLEQEGATRRGVLFQKLTHALDELRSNRESVTEFEMLALLGPPDFGQSDVGGASYAYLYDRFGKKDWGVIIDIGPDGIVNRIGWSGTAAWDTTHWKRFDAYPKIP